ncbi:ribonucleases P/MRP protein subunit POP1 [Chiloscyllium plagiosum]|uniref:ribonucleases P/MRP protein subunit POP1 n=1 Tax=Chiloscyllium plagiosum TaxID=36176 RepID=UPI001CB85AE1|nr:ribonucleases P/MRP protein subunit POP1 [Chiloscyllium plagiosum]XP_043543588.1 ribonucleases P/MRP protein subunit POP1 [Chiloscyllium plagiosum]XP_043543589.1 ribonucleases P/MRP protein subunit POP1 [Chiloscyllium plagiosum]XP_043543590.1 ribonucleases P/MRP protein subunit POP1 [Chiloscyllium plagiosum]
MSGVSRKEKKYAKLMRNQPSNITFSSTDQMAGRSGMGPSESQTTNPRCGSFTSLQGVTGGYVQQQQVGSSQPSYGDHRRSSYRGGFRGYRGNSRGSCHGYSQIPKSITATTFAQARAAEINAMIKAVTHKSGSQFLQSLPPTMRRRAMSHNIKRLPRRLQEIAKKEVEKVSQLKKEQSKSKSRKARRRHGSLLIEFNRRQRKNIWLETHIWHAKRFHMVKKWGYCLGNKPTTKSYRACYRSMTKQCLLQDLSYYCCLELNGTENNLLKALARLSSIDAGTTFASVACLSGKCQGSLVLYKADQYPEKPLGPVTFLWRPKTQPDSSSGNRQLWIWTHPALKMDLLTELQLVCQCLDVPVPEPAPNECKTITYASEKQTEVVGLKRKPQDKAGEMVIPEKKIIGNGTRDPSTTVVWTSLTNGVTIEDLTMEILRYRLIGPLSHCVIFEAIQAADVPKNPEEREETKMYCWWSEYCTQPEKMSLHNHQRDILQLLLGVASPAEISAGTVLGLTVGDPRLNMPKNRTTASPDLSQPEDLEKLRDLCLNGIGAEYAQSQIWDRNVRNVVTETKISEQKLNQMRSKLLVPGTRLDLGSQESKIPILLVHQPGKMTGQEHTGWGSGWDILIPKGWGMAFWIPLIYRGARVGGLQEGAKHTQYKGLPHFPDDFPDCPAGIQHSVETKKELIDKYNKYPPAKRPNYIHYGTMTPFRCPWQQLVEEWEAHIQGGDLKLAVSGKEQELKFEVQNPNYKHAGVHENKASEEMSKEDKPSEPDEEMEEDSESVTILERNTGCENGQNVITQDTPAESGHVSVLRSRKLLKQISMWCRPSSSRGQQTQRYRGPAQVPLAADAVKSIIGSYPRFLIWVRLSLLKKGNPIANATICVPSKEDLQLLVSDPNCPGPQESKHRDPFKQKCKALKNKKRALPKVPETTTAADLGITSVSGCGVNLVQGLWPDQIRNVMSHCSRLAIGYVSQGDFSLTVGCGEALGFVSLLGLLHMISNQPPDQRGLALVRNPASLQYRFAKINIEV